jgi:hypothetical protein
VPRCTAGNTAHAVLSDRRAPSPLPSRRPEVPVSSLQREIHRGVHRAFSTSAIRPTLLSTPERSSARGQNELWRETPPRR